MLMAADNDCGLCFCEVSCDNEFIFIGIKASLLESFGIFIGITCDKKK